MSMFNDKNVIDKYFMDNWTDTPISYEGVPFSHPKDGKWIHVAFLVYDRQVYGMDGRTGRKKDWGKIVVRCYDSSPTLSMRLANKVQLFLECIAITADDGNDIMIDMGISDEFGAVDLDNGIFEVQLSFKCIKYN